MVLKHTQSNSGVHNRLHHNLLDINDPNLLFTKRGGTTNEGGQFEDLYLADLLLKLVNNEKITKFNVWSNHPEFGAMDDIVFDLESSDDKLEGKYAVQLKYAIGGGVLIKQALAGKQGEFAILKYFKEYRIKSEAVGTFKFFLVTNKKFDVDGKEITLDNDNVQLNLSIKKLHKKNKQFKFAINGTVTEDLREYTHFFENFTLITNQESVDEISEKVRKTFISKFSCNDELVSKKYIEFVQKWSKNQKEKTALHSSLVKHVIALLMLSPRAQFLSFNPELQCKRSKLLRKAISKFSVTLLSSDSCHKIKNLWYALKERDSVGNKEYLKEARHYQIFQHHVGSLKDLNDEECTKFFWLMGKCPLIVEDSEATRKAISFCEHKKFIVLNAELNGYSGFRVFRNFLSLKKTKSKRLYNRVLSTFTCSIQGKQPIRLENLIDKKGKILSMLTVDKLVEMLDKTLSIGTPETLPPSPITRMLSRNTVKYQILDEVDLQKTVIVISCLSPINTFGDQFPHIQTVNVDEFLQEEKPNTKEDGFVVLSDDNISKEEFITLNKKVPRGQACYHFRYVCSQDGFEWVRSSTKPEILYQFLQNSTFIDEAELKRYEDDNNINLVCADPGMGKTTFAKGLMNVIDPSIWNIPIYVRDHSKYFREGDDDITKFKEYISGKIQAKNNPFDSEIVKVLAEEGRIKYFWDGLDELSDTSFKRAKRIISKLSQVDGSQHWITCRCLLRQDLETYFHVFSRTIKEFDEDDQKKYLKNRLECSDHELEDVFIKIRNNIQLFPHNDILGIPLQIYILTELLLKDPSRYSLLLDQMFSIADLYERFVDEIFNFHFKEKEGIRNMDELNDIVYERITKAKEEQVDYYKRSALKLYFDESILENFEATVEVSKEKNPTGFIISVNDDCVPEFFHNSFGEYFAASYLAEHIVKVRYINDFTFDEKYNNIRFFFDLILAKHSSIHVAVLYKNYQLLENKFTDEDFHRVDEIGRSLLEVACSWCQSYPLLKVRPAKTKEAVFIVEKPPQFRNIKLEPDVNRKILTLLIAKCRDEEIRRVLRQDLLFHGKNSIRIIPLTLLTKETQIKTELFKSNVFTILQYCVLFDYEALIGICDEIWQMLDISGKSIIYQLVQYKSIKTIKTIATITQEHEFLAKNEENLLHRACVNDDYEMVKFLIEHGVQLNSFDRNCKTAVHHACFGGSYTICRLLLQHGAQLHFRILFSKTLLHRSCSRGLIEMVQLLIEYGAPLNFKDSYGRTPLHLASANGHYEIAKFLIEKDASVNAEDLEGRTPIYDACRSRHDAVYDLLLEHGANLDFVNQKGKMVIHVASQLGHASVVNFLIEKKKHPQY